MLSYAYLSASFSNAIRKMRRLGLGRSPSPLMWTLLVALTLVCLLPGQASALSALRKMCGMENDWMCRINIEEVPKPVIEVCESCGNYWGNIPGLAYCCRCSEKIFGFCWEAVYGERR